MQLKFEGQTHSIDANTLINVLTHYQTIVQAANRELGGGDKEITLQINVIEKGSFVIDFSVVSNIIQQLFSKNYVEYAASVAGIVTFVYQVYKKCKGKRVNPDDNVVKELGNTYNVKIENVINVYNQPVVREAISKSIETANNDSAVEGFSVVGNDDSTQRISFERAEFPDYIYTDFDDEMELPLEKIEEQETTLNIITLSFEKGNKWKFLWQGFKIDIIVKDDAIMDAIDKGCRFGKGDCIRVKLRIVKKFNKEFNSYENKSYKIVEFFEIIPRPEQTNLF